MESEGITLESCWIVLPILSSGSDDGEKKMGSLLSVPDGGLSHCQGVSP